MSFLDKLLGRKTGLTSMGPESKNYIDTKRFGRIYLPAKGKFVQESHYATNNERFAGGLFPKSDQEKIQQHLLASFELFKKYVPNARFEAVYDQLSKRQWTPANDGSINEYGQGALGMMRPSLEEEMWQINFNESKSQPFTKLRVEANGRSVIVMKGYELGPGGTDFIGGVTTEVHAYLGTSNDSDITVSVCDQALPLGPDTLSRTQEPIKPKVPVSIPGNKLRGEKLLWCPFAIVPKDIKMTTKWAYPSRYPEGAIVHFTAGRDDNELEALNSLRWGRDEGYCFFLISADGVIYQTFPLSHGGSHAGKSYWPGIGSDVSNRLVGIEIACEGKLERMNGKFMSWFKKHLPENEVRFSKETDSIEEGYYSKFTEAQEKSLIRLLVWLHNNNPEVFKIDWILGHCEVSGKKGLGYWRKNDPGASLSMSMEELRILIHEKTNLGDG